MRQSSQERSRDLSEKTQTLRHNILLFNMLRTTLGFTRDHEFQKKEGMVCGLRQELPCGVSFQFCKDPVVAAERERDVAKRNLDGSASKSLLLDRTSCRSNVDSTELRNAAVSSILKTNVVASKPFFHAHLADTRSIVGGPVT